MPKLHKILAYALGPIGSAAFGIVSLPLMSWHFSAADIGSVALLQTVAGLGILLFGLGLDQAYIREYHAAADKAALLKTVLPLPLVLAAFFLMSGNRWPSEILFSSSSRGLAAGGLFIGAFLLTRFLSLTLRMQERAWAFSFSQLLPKILVCLLITGCILFSLPNHTAVLFGIYAAAQTAAVALLLWQSRRTLAAAAKAPWCADTHRAALKYGLPLAAANLTYWAFASLDRFLLKQWAGLEQLGVYAMALNFSAVALIVQSIFSTIWAPMVFKWVNDHEHCDKIGGIALLVAQATAALICLVGIASPAAARLLPEAYADVPFILPAALLVPLFYTWTEVGGIGLNVVKKTGLIAAVNLAALAANLLLLYQLVPPLGAKGAAAATAAAFWLFFILKTELSARLWQPLPRRTLYAAATACLSVCLCYTLFGNRENYPLFAAVWLAALLWLAYRNRNRFLHFVRRF
ncbi:polysaccharide biosynthesis C-terminal domain-containing protein [Neisseria sp. ZJ106]|uniref:Polysaccharide biosynthesis C-terminal domain-containing protein n=1 Tax=Neisseria lisongii TaxID=2912188 RepID=A0ABY7RL22_9NEIS|nr:polysaccharide biosynthesis C-terminal domain-containing protein [Neisseria lisongii]MCF7521793.1 polysaccharide biosynthesis C-terminal domain-containing protein [Neisseria lisongii]WCL70970.1 polysaccharide biosynthesis C-terminal domain-containing protein [Neisseria lisongii]